MTTEPPALPSQCPKCAATRAALYRDADAGLGCLVCGWHSYQRPPRKQFGEIGHYCHERRRWLDSAGEAMPA